MRRPPDAAGASRWRAGRASWAMRWCRRWGPGGCARRRRADRIADTEADSFHVYRSKPVCADLRRERSLAVDPLALGRAGMAPLVEPLADASREGCTPTTSTGADRLARAWGLPTRSLRRSSRRQGVGLRYCSSRSWGLVDKRFQRANQRASTVVALREYAAGRRPLAGAGRPPAGPAGEPTGWSGGARSARRWKAVGRSRCRPARLLRTRSARATRYRTRPVGSAWVWREACRRPDCPPFDPAARDLLQLASRPPEN